MMSTNNLPTLQKELLSLLHQKSVRFGKFTLASGKKSDFYVDARQTTLHARGSFLIASLILQRLHSDVVAIGGPVTGAIPIVGSTTLLSSQKGRNIHGFMVRKEAKGYGAQNWIEGRENMPAGSSLCVVEDTVTTGGSLLKAIQKLEEAGYKVIQTISVVDRQEGARELIEGAGFSFEAIVTREDLERQRNMQ
jgi:orotate phosphoribosyltransferase